MNEFTPEEHARLVRLNAKLANMVRLGAQLRDAHGSFSKVGKTDPKSLRLAWGLSGRPKFAPAPASTGLREHILAALRKPRAS